MSASVLNRRQLSHACLGASRRALGRLDVWTRRTTTMLLPDVHDTTHDVLWILDATHDGPWRLHTPHDGPQIAQVWTPRTTTTDVPAGTPGYNVLCMAARVTCSVGSVYTRFLTRRVSIQARLGSAPATMVRMPLDHGCHGPSAPIFQKDTDDDKS